VKGGTTENHLDSGVRGMRGIKKNIGGGGGIRWVRYEMRNSESSRGARRDNARRVARTSWLRKILKVEERPQEKRIKSHREKTAEGSRVKKGSIRIRYTTL